MSLATVLGERLRGRVIVVGVGNPWRGDDGVGCRVAARLRKGGVVRSIDAAEIPESFLGDIISAGPETVVFVDAVDLGAPAGAVAIVDRGQLGAFVPNTHHAPLQLLMELVVAVTDADVFMLGIQPQRFDLLSSLSASVESAADGLADLVEYLIAAKTSRPFGVTGVA